MNRKVLVAIIVIVVLGVVGFFLFSDGGLRTSGDVVSGEVVEMVPLDSLERSKVVQMIESSEFVGDMPRNGVIALRFYSFKDGKKVWRDGFLIGKDGLLSNGESDIYLAIHVKYIEEIGESSLCDITKKANDNGDLGFYSEKSKVRLLIKYVGMLKHRECFGF